MVVFQVFLRPRGESGLEQARVGVGRPGGQSTLKSPVVTIGPGDGNSEPSARILSELRGSG